MCVCVCVCVCVRACISNPVQPFCCQVAALDDQSEWNDMVEAMKRLEFEDSEKDAVLDIVTFVIKLGEVQFEVRTTLYLIARNGATSGFQHPRL